MSYQQISRIQSCVLLEINYVGQNSGAPLGPEAKKFYEANALPMSQPAQTWSNLIMAKKFICTDFMLTKQAISMFPTISMGSSTNDVTQIWRFYDTPSTLCHSKMTV